MRPILLFLLGLALSNCIAQSIYSDNFDSYGTGTRMAVNVPGQWQPWSALPGSTQDVPVTTAYSKSSPNSLAFVQAVPGYQGGPVDAVLDLGYHTTGAFVLQFSMYVVGELGAFLELLHGEGPSADPAAVIYFTPETLGEVDCQVDGGSLTGFYPHNTWFDVVFSFDLDVQLASLSVNNHFLGSWNFATMPSGTSTPNVLGSLRFIASSGSDFFAGEYYMDDLSYTRGYVGISGSYQLTPKPLSIAPNPIAGSALFSVEKPLQNAQLTLHDASGRMVWNAPWPPGSVKFTLPENALAPGTYLVRVSEAGQGGYSGRLVVMP
ncbi:MAG: T9SS type A sorting domain-containing protein [Flavobacteriales bacterium]|nr:T9SS type A sorting domain-containing protein [Flavobacteriales bacterium]